jgi:hypothetical protein
MLKETDDTKVYKAIRVHKAENLQIKPKKFDMRSKSTIRP